MTTFVVCVFLSVDRFVVCVFLSVDRFDDTLKKCRVYVELMKRFPETVAKVGVSNNNFTNHNIYVTHTHIQTHTRVAYKQRCTNTHCTQYHQESFISDWGSGSAVQEVLRLSPLPLPRAASTRTPR